MSGVRTELSRIISISIWSVAAVAGMFLVPGFLACPPAFAQLSTSDHLGEPGFWPTQNVASRDQFAGAAVCANCHAAKTASQKLTSMARTSLHADGSEILHSHPKMNFAVGDYHYEIKTGAKESSYTVTGGTEGSNTISATLLWAFGIGRVAQSYLFKKGDGNFYESRVTYFTTLQNLNFTPARALASPKDVAEAMYRPVPSTEIVRCFGCHTTASTIGGQFDEKNLILGVSCEACHGPGVKHVAAMQAAALAGTTENSAETIVNPARLNPVDMVDFCGACHGTWWDVKFSGGKGVTTARSAPFRLEESKCWGKGDARLTCIACHDPHVEVRTDPTSYDRACLSCHPASGTAKTASTEPSMHPSGHPAGTKDCVTCHMPKVYDPDMHYKFTDHRIRIVHEGEAYPD
jgi:hypothetical protein